MANNRLYLKNNITGERVLLAKTFVCSGWGEVHFSPESPIEEFFTKNKQDPTGETHEWELEYEH